MTSETWPRKINKAFIAIGVIALGLVVTDQVLDAFRGDGDAQDALAVVGNLPKNSLPQESAISGSGTTAPATAMNDAAFDEVSEAAAGEQAGVAGSVTGLEKERLLDFESLFGTRVVFVSAAEPAFVLTEDEQRFEVGSAINDSMTLAGVTTHQLILEQSGNLTIISLPEPSEQ